MEGNDLSDPPDGGKGGRKLPSDFSTDGGERVLGSKAPAPNDRDEEVRSAPREAVTRPDVAARLLRRKVIQSSAVKMTLKTLSLDDGLTKEIDRVLCARGHTHLR